MNFAHLHIVLNHIPSLGTVAAVGLFSFSLVKRHPKLKEFSLQLLVMMALLALPTYMSGNASQFLLRNNTEVPKAIVDAHQDSAMVTLILMTITGTFAWFGLWQFRRFSRVGHLNSAAVLIFSILTAVFILRTANIGGEIRHSEIRLVEAAPAAESPAAQWRESVEAFTNSHSWVWPASETVHFIGMALLFGVTLLVNLRMLGMMKSIPFAALHRLLPLGIFGFVVNVISGMVFFISSPGLYITNPGFAIKISLLVVAGLGLIYFTVFEKPWTVGPDQNAPLSAKVAATTVMILLLGVMYFGRLLPFINH